jgi:hypothetical protein
MGEGLHYRYEDESREVEIGDIDFIAMSLQIAAHQRITLADISLDIFEAPNSWDLFRKDRMQLGVDPMPVYCN